MPYKSEQATQVGKRCLCHEKSEKGDVKSEKKGRWVTDVCVIRRRAQRICISGGGAVE